jgi:hypothetical protein
MMQSFDPHVVIKPVPNGTCFKAYQTDSTLLQRLPAKPRGNTQAVLLPAAVSGEADDVYVGIVHVEVERRYDNYFYKMQVRIDESTNFTCVHNHEVYGIVHVEVERRSDNYFYKMQVRIDESTHAKGVHDDDVYVCIVHVEAERRSDNYFYKMQVRIDESTHAKGVHDDDVYVCIGHVEVERRFYNYFSQDAGEGLQCTNATSVHSGVRVDVHTMLMDHVQGLCGEKCVVCIMHGVCIGTVHVEVQGRHAYHTHRLMLACLLSNQIPAQCTAG